jgi:hypothetical protein
MKAINCELEYLLGKRPGLETDEGFPLYLAIVINTFSGLDPKLTTRMDEILL